MEKEYYEVQKTQDKNENTSNNNNYFEEPWEEVFSEHLKLFFQRK